MRTGFVHLSNCQDFAPNKLIFDPKNVQKQMQNQFPQTQALFRAAAGHVAAGFRFHCH